MPYKRNIVANKNKKRRFRKKRFNAKWKLGLRTPLGSINFDSKKMKAIAKGVVHKNMETKRVIHTSSVASSTHSTFYTLNPLSSINQGSGHNQRLGDKIHLLNLRAKMHFYSSSSANNQFWRILFLAHDQEYASASTTLAASRLTSGETFISFDNALDSFPDYKQMTPISDQIIKLPDQNQLNQVVGLCKELDINLNRDFVYKSGTNFSAKTNYYLLVIPHIEGGSPGVTSTGGIECQWLLTFKDA